MTDTDIARQHAVALEQCSLYGDDIGEPIGRAMRDAAAFLRELSKRPSDTDPSTKDALRGDERKHSDTVRVEAAEARAAAAEATLTKIATVLSQEPRTYTWNESTHRIQSPHLSDIEVAATVRMLMRNQLDHESVCTLGRDRIVHLSERLLAVQAIIAGEENCPSDEVSAESQGATCNSSVIAAVYEWVERSKTACDQCIESIGPIQANTGEDVEAGRVAAYQKGYQVGYRNAVLDIEAIAARAALGDE